MFGKGRIICSLVILALVAGFASADGYQPAPPDPNIWGTSDLQKEFNPNSTYEGRRATFDWFDTDTWYSSDLSPNDAARYTFTYSAAWNDTPNLDYNNLIMINNLDYRNDVDVHVTLDSATSGGCHIVAAHLAVGRWYWCHWGDLRVDGVNITIGQSPGTFNCGWNPFTWAREGHGWITLKDMVLKADAIEGSGRSVTPTQYDPCDANNLDWDPATWTMPWPSKCDVPGALYLKGTTQVIHQEPGFFIRFGRPRGSDCWPALPGGKRSDLYLDSTVTYNGVDANVAPNPDPNWGMGYGTWIRMHANSKLHWGLGASAALCTMEMSAMGELYPGVEIELYPETGYTNPAGGTQKVLMNVGQWHTDPVNNELPSLTASTDPNWTLTFQGLSLVATYADPDAHVIARKVFHNNSAFDGNNAAANASDDAAVDTSKQALLPGNAATMQNVVANVKGINGVMIDIQGLAGTVTAADFTIERSGVSNGGVIGNYSAASGPTTVAVRAGAGVGGSDRVTLIFPDSDADNSKWMRITTAANANTGLAAADVCYIGLAVGETGNSSSNFEIDANDRYGTRQNPHDFLDPAPVNDAYDFDRDKDVGGNDRYIQRQHATDFLNDLAVITAP